MVEHLSWVFELSTGLASVECPIPEAKRERYKAFLHDNTPMLREFRNPALVSGLPALRHAGLDDALAALRKDVDRFLDHARDAPAATHAHPVFGPIGPEEWSRSHFKHAYHHLLQFGLVEGAAAERVKLVSVNVGRPRRGRVARAAGAHRDLEGAGGGPRPRHAPVPRRRQAVRSPGARRPGQGRLRLSVRALRVLGARASGTDALPWGAFGENLTTEGLLEARRPASATASAVGTAELEVTDPRMPCYKLGVRFERDDMVKRFLAQRRHRLLPRGACAKARSRPAIRSSSWPGRSAR